MRGERDKSRDRLMNEYAIGARLAARIVALRSRKIDVSPAVLETAANCSPLRELLLDRTIFDDPDVLSTDWLQERASEKDYTDPDLLRVSAAQEEDWRTIAFEDELLAERVEQEEESPAGQMVQTPENGPGLESPENLFEPEQVEQLKLAALTSQNPGDRIEALRKLVYAPADPGEKAGVFVRTLIDSAAEAPVRQEAVTCLKKIGFREELTDAVHRLFEADESDVLYSIRRLHDLLEEGDESEMGLALAVILQLFADSTSSRVLEELLQLITQSAPVLSGHDQKTQQFVRTALRNLNRFYPDLAAPLQKAIAACHKACPETVEELLWAETDRSHEPHVRGFILVLLCDLCSGGRSPIRLAEAAVEGILESDIPEQQRVQLRYALARFGEASVQAAHSKLTNTTGRRRAELVRLLDTLCSETDAGSEVINEAVDSVIDTLEVGDHHTRHCIVETSIIADERLNPRMKKRVTEELLGQISDFRLESTIDEISQTIEQLGPPAVEPLLSYVKRRYPREDADRPFRSLGKIAEKWHGQIEERHVQASISFCRDLMADPQAGRGSFIVPYACFTGYTDAGSSHFHDLLDQLKQLIGEAGFTYQSVEAMGILAGSPNADIQHQREIFQQFKSVLHMEGPEVQGRKYETEEGTVYEFGNEMMFDLQLLPKVLQGLKHIGTNSHIPQELRRELVSELLILWEGASHVRVVWGPGAMSSLIETICAVAACDETPGEMSARLGRSILRFLNKVKVVRSLGEICSRPATDPHIHQLCLETGEAMLGAWETCEEQDEERRAALLVSLGKLAANPGLDQDKPEVSNLRENILSALFRGLREDIQEVRGPLEMLSECPALSSDKRHSIKERLSRVSGLVRTETQ